jgi:hypothetical protein
MFETLASIAAAWREIAHVSEMTGLSIGLLVTLVVIVWLDPAIRGFAIKIAIVVVVAYVSGLYWYRVGASDVRAQWDAANVRAAEAAKTRDASISHTLDQEFPPPPAADEVSQNENAILAAIRAAGGGVCPIGAVPLRLRN